MIERQTIGDRIRIIRQRNSLTTRDFAKKIMCASCYISLIETNRRNMSDTIIDRVSNAFGINKNWLLYGDKKCSAFRNWEAPVNIIPLINSLMSERTCYAG